MEKLGIYATEYNYKEKDKYLKEQFIYGINDNAVTTKIIKELTAAKNTNDITRHAVFYGIQEQRPKGLKLQC